MRNLILSATALLLLSAIANPTTAAPPPGHPSVKEAEKALGIPDQKGLLPYRGRVIEAFNSNNYTYIHVNQSDGDRWLAVPRLALEIGDIIAFGDGAQMTNFYSKVHRRTFDKILFTGKIQVIEKKM